MAKIQSIKNKLGEVKFRQKLTKQFSGESEIFPGEPSSKEYFDILNRQLKDSQQIFQQLQLQNIPLSPFLEIGSGEGLRSMLLVNEFDALGIASDLSIDTLSSASWVKKRFCYDKAPTSICCDAYSLPFASNSFAFVFCFQTLHHLPDPKPVFQEIYRVLAPGGYFYFGEEPVAQIFNLNLWRRDMHLTWGEKILKATTLLHFISRIGKTEVEQGILEETFDLSTWEKAINVFDSAEVKLKAFPFGPTIVKEKISNNDWINPPFAKKWILKILGGGISGLCQKSRKKINHEKLSLDKILTCPNCKNKPLQKIKQNELKCNHCASVFKKQRGIFMLLPSPLSKKLYG